MNVTKFRAMAGSGTPDWDVVVVATVTSALRVQDARLEQAAATLGAPPWAAFRHVTLPLVPPAVLSSLLVAMVLTFDKLIVSLFVNSACVRPVTVQMWSNLLGDFDPTIREALLGSSVRISIGGLNLRKWPPKPAAPFKFGWPVRHLDRRVTGRRSC